MPFGPWLQPEHTYQAGHFCLLVTSMLSTMEPYVQNV